MGGSSSSGDRSSDIRHRTELQAEVTSQAPVFSQAPVEVKEGLTTRDSDQDSDEVRVAAWAVYQAAGHQRRVFAASESQPHQSVISAVPGCRVVDPY